MPSATSYLLDTNIVIHLIKEKPPEVRVAMEAAGGYKSTAISTLTVHELRFGAGNSLYPEKTHATLDAFFTRLSILDLDTDAASHAAEIRAALRSQPIGPYDILIAGHARSLGATLVTRNVKEFRRVPGLKVVAW